MQDTFVAIWRKPESFGGTGEVAAWIWGIGIRRLIDRLRRARPSSVLFAPRVPDDEPSAEEQVLLGVEYGDLAGALHRLSPELRAAIALDPKYPRARQNLCECLIVKGRLAEVVQALRDMHTRLEWIPLDFGEPLRDLPHLGIQIRIGPVAPLVVTYGVDEARRIVYVSVPFDLLPKSGL